MVARHWTWEPQGGARDGSPIPACIQTSEVKQVPFLQGFSGPSLLLRDPGGAGWGSFQILSLGAPRGECTEGRQVLCPAFQKATYCPWCF